MTRTIPPAGWPMPSRSPPMMSWMLKPLPGWLTSRNATSSSGSLLAAQEESTKKRVTVQIP